MSLSCDGCTNLADGIDCDTHTHTHTFLVAVLEPYLSSLCRVIYVVVSVIVMKTYRGTGGISPLFLILALGEVCGQVYASAATLPGKNPGTH